VDFEWEKVGCVGVAVCVYLLVANSETDNPSTALRGCEITDYGILRQKIGFEQEASWFLGLPGGLLESEVCHLCDVGWKATRPPRLGREEFEVVYTIGEMFCVAIVMTSCMSSRVIHECLVFCGG